MVLNGLVNLAIFFSSPSVFIKLCLSVEFMLRNRPFRLFVFHILLAVLTFCDFVGVCVNNKTRGCQNLCERFEMAAVADPS